MKVSRLLLLGLAALGSSAARAQIDLPVNNVSLAYPSLPGIAVRLGSTNRNILPSPFVLSGAFSDSALWFCMDPLQTIYTRASGLPASAKLHYGSEDPADYDRWTSHAPGLNSARLQDLADLFTAYAPTRTNAIVGAALQLAVPEITNEFDSYSFSLTSGKFRASGNGATAHSILSLAQQMLASLGDPSVKNHGDVRSLRFLIDGSFRRNQCDTVPVQDLVGFVPVPEPSTYAIAAAGLVVLLAGRRLVRPGSKRPSGTPAGAV